jgi:flagellar secretion chaperone FliS
MNPKAAQTYFRTRVLTATPEQLQMMLFDGALRFCEQGKLAMEKKDYETSFNTISRVQKILCQLTGSLRHEQAPDLCGKLASLYNYAYRKLLQASTKRDLEALEEATRVLRYQRETWALLMDQLGKAKAGAAAANLSIPTPSERMEASISMQG